MTRLDREKIAGDIVRKVGARRANEGGVAPKPPNPKPLGVEGVDATKNGKFRSRISFSDALSGKFTRLTLGTFGDLEEAYYAYQVAHISIWGALSYFKKELILT